jgi:ubiquinol-cytochrome c reductase cytochrome c1 subunit
MNGRTRVGFLLTGVLVLGMISPGFSWASESRIKLEHANINPRDVDSLRRGAKYFVDYCFGCHSIQFMRYSRVAKDLKMKEEDVSKTMLFTGARIGDPMSNAMDKKDAKHWFGNPPPDLSVETRARGVDWIYTYLRSFYKDPSRPWGVNNAVFKDVAMPDVLWELQGLQDPIFSSEKDSKGESEIKGFKLLEKGKMNKEQFDNTVRDIVNFLAYVGEPTKLQRLSVGRWVLGFLAIYFVIMFLLKKEYWKDVK